MNTASQGRIIADHGQDFPIGIGGQQAGIDADLHGFLDELAIGFQGLVTEKHDPAILAGQLYFGANARPVKT